MAKKQNDYNWNEDRIAVADGYIKQGFFPNYHKIREDMGMSSDKKKRGQVALNKMLAEKYNFRIEGSRRNERYILEGKKEKMKSYDITKGKANKTNYHDEMKLVILNLIKNNYDAKGCYDMQITSNQTFLGCNMVNENYLIASKEIPCTSNILDVPTDNLYNFFKTVRSTFRRGFERALDSLQGERLLFWEFTYFVRKKVVQYNINCLGETVEGDFYYEDREATKEEIKVILKIEKEVLNEMGYEEIGLVQGANWNKFKDKVSKRHKEYKTNIEYSYRAYSITVNDDFIETKLENTKEAREMLNDKLMFTQIRNAKSRYNKSKPAFGKTFNIQGDSSYVPIYSMLVSTMIDEDADSIITKEKIEEYKKLYAEQQKKLREENKKKLREVA